MKNIFEESEKERKGNENFCSIVILIAFVVYIGVHLAFVFLF